MELFQSRFVADQRADDVPIFRRVLLPDDHKVAIQDAVLDHAVAFDLEGKGLFAARELGGDRNKSFDVFFRQYRRARPDPPNDWSFLRLRESGPSRLANDLNGTCANALYVALSFQGLEMVKDATGRSYFEPLTNLWDGRGVTFLANGNGKKLVDLSLPVGKGVEHEQRLLKIILVTKPPRISLPFSRAKRLNSFGLSRGPEMVLFALSGLTQKTSATQC